MLIGTGNPRIEVRSRRNGVANLLDFLLLTPEVSVDHIHYTETKGADRWTF